MKSLIQYFIKYSTAGNVIILLLVFLGLMGFYSLRSTLMPQIDLGVINIMTTYPGASPEEVEQGVVLKIEENIQGISGIKKNHFWISGKSSCWRLSMAPRAISTA